MRPRAPQLGPRGMDLNNSESPMGIRSFVVTWLCR